MENYLSYPGSSAYGILFLGILGEYTGIPLPGSILLILAGALSYEGRLNGFVILCLAFVAAPWGTQSGFPSEEREGKSFLTATASYPLEARTA